MAHDACEGRSDEAGGARDDDAREILQQVQLKRVEFFARLFFEDGSGFVTVEVGVGDDGGKVDAREGERSVLAEDVGERLAVDFAEVASRYHLFQMLCAGLFGGFVDVPVILRRTQFAEAARLHVDDGGRLGAVRELLEVAGVLPRGVDRADVGVRLLVGGGKERGDGVVDDGDGDDVSRAAPCERFFQKVVDDLALDALRRELLRPSDELGVVEVGLHRREGEGVTEQVRRRAVALDGFVDEFGEEVEHLLGGGVCRHIVVNARLGQGLRRLLDDLVPAASVQQDVQGAYVRAAEVECEEIADLLARRQGDVGAQHAQRGIFARKSRLHLRLEVGGNLLKLVVTDAEVGEHLVVFLLVHGHGCSSSYNMRCRQGSIASPTEEIPLYFTLYFIDSGSSSRRRLGKLPSPASESLLVPSSAYSRRMP